MVFDGLRRTLRTTFRRKAKSHTPQPVDVKNKLPCKVMLLDGTDISVNLKKGALGSELLRRVLMHLDLVEKDYFALQFMDTKQVPHWLDPMKKIKRQVVIGPPYTLHFRVKFYAPNPQTLHEELTRYQFFLQIKQDILRGRFRPTSKQSIELGGLSIQSELGDYDNTLHIGNYVSEFKLFPDQNEDLDRSIERKHRTLCGKNPAECEKEYLAIACRLRYYGMDRHAVKGSDNRDYKICLTPQAIVIMEGDMEKGSYFWKSIADIKFQQSEFLLDIIGNEINHEKHELRYVLPTPRASKHLWKCAIEYHTFFRLLATSEAPKNKTFAPLRRSSTFTYRGRTLSQVKKEDAVNTRRTLLFKRTRSERITQRSTIGYIRYGAIVWARAINGDYYKGEITALKDKVHVKFENGDTIIHDRTDETALVYDMDPKLEELDVGTRVIAHWSGLSALLPGRITKIDGKKYYVHYDDGDQGTNRIEQMRVLKPQLFYGANVWRSKSNRYSMTTTALIGSTTTASIASDDLPKTSTSTDVNRANRAESNVSVDDVFSKRNSPASSPHNKKSRKTLATNSPLVHQSSVEQMNQPRTQSVPVKAGTNKRPSTTSLQTKPSPKLLTRNGKSKTGSVQITEL